MTDQGGERTSPRSRTGAETYGHGWNDTGIYVAPNQWNFILGTKPDAASEFIHFTFKTFFLWSSQC